jgi:hypothetical protein
MVWTERYKRIERTGKTSQDGHLLLRILGPRRRRGLCSGRNAWRTTEPSTEAHTGYCPRHRLPFNSCAQRCCRTAERHGREA